MNVFPALLSLFFFSSLCPAVANGSEGIDWASLDAERRVDVITSTHIDEIEFSEYSLLQCLQAVSNKVREARGRSFSISIIGADQQPDRLVSMRLRDITVREVLELLATASESRIEMTKKGCIVDFDDVLRQPGNRDE